MTTRQKEVYRGLMKKAGKMLDQAGVSPELKSKILRQEAPRAVIDARKTQP